MPELVANENCIYDKKTVKNEKVVEGDEEEERDGGKTDGDGSGRKEWRRSNRKDQN